MSLTSVSTRVAIALLSMLSLLGAPGCGDDDARRADASVPDGGPPVAVPTSSFQDEILYFVLIDRFANGDPGNDQGGGAFSAGGHDPDDARAYHGGDLAGLINRLDYIQGLGATALWLNPVVANRAEQPGSWAYHGYWGLDFLSVDPHWGTNEDFARLVQAAHDRGMKVYLDVVVNHTADVIGYEQCVGCPYRPLNLPPYDPIVPQAFQVAKNPAWLNDPQYYNNRGDSTFSGESAVYGDFVGLDDLDTRQQAVIDGMIDIWRYWVEQYRIDGFRLDTVKHVDIELWQQFAPALLEAAAAQGIEHFTMFGEVFDYQVSQVSRFTTEGKLPSVLDFPLQGAMRNVFSQNGPTSALAGVFDQDDYYTDADSSALMLANFLGNHDIGRFGHFLAVDGSGRPDDEQVERSKLAHAFAMFARGVPVIYYGDEQGFTGDGGDTGARQDMLASKVQSYGDDDSLGTAKTPADDNFDTSHPIYQAIAAYAALYKQHAPLRRGVQLQRYSSDSAGIFAFSRVIPGTPADSGQDAGPAPGDPDVLVEYLAVFNSSTEAREATVPTGTPNATFQAIHPANAMALASDERGNVQVAQSGLSVALYRADRPMPAVSEPMSVTLRSPAPGVRVRDRVEVAAELTTPGSGDDSVPGLVGVTFEVKHGTGSFQTIGTDWTPPYRVFWDSSVVVDTTGDATGDTTEVTFRATAASQRTMVRSSEVQAVVDWRIPEKLVVHYENGNARTQAVLITDSGVVRGPVPVSHGVVELPVAVADKAYFLLFEDRAGDRFSFDQPVFVSAQDLSGFAREDGNGGLRLEVYLNNAHELAASNNFLSTGAPPVLAASDQAPAPFGDRVLYARGAMNGWGLGHPMAYVGNYTYKATLALDPGSVEHKFADEQWQELNFGGPYGAPGLVNAGNSSNLTFVTPSGGTYDFYLFSIPAGNGAKLQFHHVIPTPAPEARAPGTDTTLRMVCMRNRSCQ